MKTILGSTCEIFGTGFFACWLVTFKVESFITSAHAVSVSAFSIGNALGVITTSFDFISESLFAVLTSWWFWWSIVTVFQAVFEVMIGTIVAGFIVVFAVTGFLFVLVVAMIFTVWWSMVFTIVHAVFMVIVSTFLAVFVIATVSKFVLESSVTVVSARWWSVSAIVTVVKTSSEHVIGMVDASFVTVAFCKLGFVT